MTIAGDMLNTLSDRELQVFAQIARGHTLAAIARELGLNHASISTYRVRALRKLGLHTNADIVLTARAAGIVKGPGE